MDQDQCFYSNYQESQKLQLVAGWRNEGGSRKLIFLYKQRLAADKRNVVQDSLDDEDDDKEVSKHLNGVKVVVELYFQSIYT